MPPENSHQNSAAQAGLAEREAASAAIQAQNQAAQASRADTDSYQAGADSRDVSFNPNSEAGNSQAQAGREALGANVPGGQQGGSVQGASGVAGSTTTGDSDWESLIDAAKGLGYQFPEGISDDRAALLHVLNQARRNQEADYYAQLGRQLAPHYQGIQQYLGQQQAQQPQQPPEWQAPEFDQKWLALVDRDPTSGMFIGKPGVNPQLVDAVNKYDRWFQKYGMNPQAAVRPMLEAELPKMLGTVLDQRFAQWQRDQTVNQILQRNAEWMYQTNADGRPTIGVGGRPVPTPAGMRYSQLVGQLEQGGMSDPTLVDQLARNLLMGEMAMGQLRSAHQQSPAQQQQTALASGRAQANVNQSRPLMERAATAGATEPHTEGMSLVELLRKNMDEAGITDQDIQNMQFGDI